MLKRLLWVGIAVTSGMGWAQTADTSSAVLETIKSQLNELEKDLLELRNELATSRSEAAQLRHELDEIRRQTAQDSAPGSLNQRVTSVEDQQEQLTGKINDQYQTKVESASKYRLQFSGMALFTAGATRGGVNDLDLPTLAEPGRSGDRATGLGGSVRQSQLGIQGTGPKWLGARTSGTVRFDFFGGFPGSSDGLTAGLVRMRTAAVVLDWEKTSLVAGQDTPFFSPLSPTSLISAAYPSMSGSGNLWVWTPQVYVEHRTGSLQKTQLALRGGFLDPLTGEAPLSEYDRKPTAGERGRVPGLASMIELRHSVNDRTALFGIGGYYARQDWGANRIARAFTATVHWELPVVADWLLWSGELYRGRAIGGLGAGPNASVLFSGEAALASTRVLPIESLGGWSQIQFKLTPRWQWNLVFGQDQAFGTQLDSASSEYIKQNRTWMLNVIYRPRSNLLLSTEYRHIFTRPSATPPLTADNLSIGTGFLF